jgi:hypothetical protein
MLPKTALAQTHVPANASVSHHFCFYNIKKIISFYSISSSSFLLKNNFCRPCPPIVPAMCQSTHPNLTIFVFTTLPLIIPMSHYTNFSSTHTGAHHHPKPHCHPPKIDSSPTNYGIQA